MTKWLLVIAPIFTAIASVGATAGSPQILALVETVGPVAMTCGETTCRAELSAFCLQQDRPAPGHGTPYVATNSEAFHLVLRSEDGKTERLPASNHLAITSVRGYSAVTVSLPRLALARLGAVQATVEVGAKVSLLPTVLAKDPDHGDDPEVALATGVLRDVGRKIVDRGGAAIVAIRATNALINAVPSGDMTNMRTGDEIWRTAVAGPMAGADTRGLTSARAAFNDCATRMRYLGGDTVRLCLQFHHDSMVQALTREYWQAVAAGS